MYTRAGLLFVIREKWMTNRCDYMHTVRKIDAAFFTGFECFFGLWIRFTKCIIDGSILVSHTTWMDILCNFYSVSKPFV